MGRPLRHGGAEKTPRELFRHGGNSSGGQRMLKGDTRRLPSRPPTHTPRRHVVTAETHKHIHKPRDPLSLSRGVEGGCEKIRGTLWNASEESATRSTSGHRMLDLQLLLDYVPATKGV